MLPILLFALTNLIISLISIKQCGCNDVVADSIDGLSTEIFRGYLKKEYLLIKPYQGGGMEIPNWNIFGSVMVSQNQIRLTPDIQSRNGAIWNKYPCTSSDWELIINFRVHGSTGALFGDGLAIWYVQQPGLLGNVFGSNDYFRGLGIFLDTYSNHNGPHKHSHPYISAMVSNGTLHYDHDSDGTHTQLGGDHTGCEAKFRNKDHDTQILIRYVGDTLSLFTDISDQRVWTKCMKIDGVHLPTNYHFGISAGTGDLSDNHDVISIRMFEQEYVRIEGSEQGKRESIDPFAESVSAPRDHVVDKRPSKLGWIGTIFLIIVAIVLIVGVLGFGLFFFQQRQERSRKRFY